MAFNRYFQDELDYLRRSGAEFATYFPKLSTYLSDRSNDPDVDRVLEGFAFLTARLREKIDDELPEVTQTLISLLWPNYLRPIPSMCIMRLDPVPGAIDERQTIRGGERPDPDDDGAAMVSGMAAGRPCQYRLCSDVEILPLTVTGARAETSREASIVTIELASLNGEPLNAIGMERLRFHLGNSDFSALTLNLWIHRYLGSARVEYVPGEGGPPHVRVLDAGAIGRGGLGADEAAIPYPNNTFPGYRLLQEYYAFPQKYHFVTVDDMPPAPDGATAMRLVMEFVRPLPPDVRVDGASFQLHCVPAINLFEHDATPILLDGKRVSYPVIPAGRDAGEYDVFQVEEVTGWRSGGEGGGRGDGDGLTRTYHRFESFHHEVERVDGREAVYFRELVRQHISGEGLARHVSFVTEDERLSARDRETISMRLTCTNGFAPLELRVGDLTVPGHGMPAYVTPTNITRPTAPLYPVVDGTLQWMLISSLSLNYLSLLSRDAIRTILAAYDFGARVDRQREREARLRLDGILRIDTRTTDRLFRGLPVRGMESTLTIRESNYASEGEMYLFTTVLAEFFALYSTINSFHHLKVIGTENGEVYEWTPKVGRQPLL